MALLTAAELKRIERQFRDGVSSVDIVQVFQDKGERFSEPTLRKYVQLGLLPKSKRVGIRGRHRGSSGLYPVAVVRLINEIKRALSEGYTLESIRFSNVGLTGEVQVLEKALEQVSARFREALGHVSNASKRKGLKQGLNKHLTALGRNVRELEKFAGRLGGEVSQ